MSVLEQSLSHSWAPFVLVVGLLFIGHVASREGLFEFLGSLAARSPGNDFVMFAVTMLATALVTALLNLDTSVVFMTPVALNAARKRGADETAFLYGAIFMSNAASLLLFGSNLTNLLIFASRPARGTTFASHMFVPWLVSVALTIVIVAGWRYRSLRRTSTRPTHIKTSLHMGPGIVASVVAGIAMLALSQPALVVLALGLIVESYELVIRRRIQWTDSLRVASPFIIAPLFVLAVVVGWIGREWHGAQHLVAHSSSLVTAFVGAGTSLVINNLPAASLFAGQHVAHPYALLLGLDLGPNAFVTGAMSSLLWLRVSRGAGATPTLRSFVFVGVPLTLVSLVLTSLLV
jgi:arsenical pump membrane protein